MTKLETKSNNMLLPQHQTVGEFRLADSLAGIFYSAFDSIILLDNEGIIRLANPATLEMTGWAANEVEGRHISFLVSEIDDTREEPEDLGPIVGPNRLMAAGLLRNSRLHYTKKDGDKVPVLLSASTENDSFGNTTGIVCISKDLNDITQIEQQLTAEREANYSEKVQAISSMAGGLAHEINNPLAIVRGISELLSEKSKNTTLSHEFIDDKTKRIAKAVTRIKQVVTALMAFSKSSDNFPHQQTTLNKVLSDSLALFSERIQSSWVNLSIDKIPADITIDCQPTELGQVILHLMSNAFDAVQEQESPAIKIGFNDLEESMELSFQDNGPGISPEILENMTLPFVTGKQIGSGMGLGLSYSKGIIEKLGGELKHRAGKKTTTFVVVLPKPQ